MRRLLAVSLLAAMAPAQFRVAAFEADVTPPIGSALCDGLVLPARKIVDRLRAKGIVILAPRQRPIVLCAVDWVGIGNTGSRWWRQRLADLAHTTPGRVAVHCLHPHDAPGCDFAAYELLQEHGLGDKMFPARFARQAVERVGEAMRAALERPVRVTHVGFGRAKVERVASNRRILGPDGKVAIVRFSKSKDPKAQAAPEGVIDPFARVVAFYAGSRPVAVLSYYATHPQSYYGSGGISPDFVGLARNASEKDLPKGAHWVHFNGCGGNVAAGKYNDGAPARRQELTHRLAQGLRQALRNAKRQPIRALDWRTTEVALPPAPSLDEKTLRSRLADPKLATVERIRAARDLVWLQRCRRGETITLGCLSIGDARLLHLPGEMFVEYQLFANALRPDLHVCTAAYGDYGPGYIGTRIAYSQGGYEVGKVSRVAPAVEAVLRRGLRELLRDETSFRAGAAKVVITPEEPIRLAGYAARTKPSAGVLQDLHAKALALVDPKGETVLLLTADLLGVTKAITDRVRARLREDHDIDRIVLATSHTHTAPALSAHLPPMYAFDANERARVERYTRFVEDQLVAVGKQAFARLAPANLAFANGRCDFAVNRRNNKEAAVPELREAERLQGPVDHDVPVLKVTDAQGKLRAVVFGYACHCTVLSFRRISGDYAGFAQSELEAAHEGAVAMFVAGCGGDQNPLPRREVALAKRYGRQLARSVDAVLRTRMTGLEGPLRTAGTLQELAFEKLPTVAELEARRTDENVYQRRRAKLLLSRLPLGKTYPYPIQALRFGDRLTWVTLGGEVTVDYAHAIKKMFGRKRTFVAAYCNDVMAYIPSRRVWNEGGYEGAGAMVYYGQPSRWAATVERDVLGAVKRTVAKTLAAELPRIPPREPVAARQTFQVAPGHTLDLVASEPQVVDPIDLEFDEHGRMWVVEMRDYPFDERDGHAPAGRIRVLTDEDKDGCYETSAVFADELSWPSALALWQGGVFVVAAPNLFYLKDTNGDGKADHKEVVFEGFGRKNVQTLANNLVLQPDGWFYGAGGGNGGRIVSKRRPGVEPVLLRGRDFRFHPDGRFEPLTGGGQFGHTIDALGRRFVCNNSDHARHIVVELDELERNPRVPSPNPVRSIAVEGGAAKVYRRSPAEPWRVVRTRLRVGGQVGGPIEHGGAVSGYFTSATGITLWNGTLIIGDVASNLVHQKTLTRNGLSFRAKRKQVGHELLASTDIWFRPTNFAVGPDGELYVCDMYREVVEHPWSLPDEIKSNLDLMSGQDRGRIWRIRTSPIRAKRRPGLAMNWQNRAAVVERLDSANLWIQRTAIRKLLEWGGAECRHLVTAYAQRKTGASSTHRDVPGRRGRRAAWQILGAWDSLSEEMLRRGLEDVEMQDVAVELLRTYGTLKDPRTRRALRRVSTDSAEARLRLALALQRFTGTDILMRLADLAEKAHEPILRAAILNALPVDSPHEFLTYIQNAENVDATFVRELGQLIARTQADSTRAVAEYVEKKGRHADALQAGIASARRAEPVAPKPIVRHASPDRAAVIRKYAKALTLKGDPKRGLAVFTKTCIVCHRHDDKGNAIGPDIQTVQQRTAKQLLEQILDPNREVNPAYVSYLAETEDGRSFAGVIESESKLAVTLRQVDGGRVRLLRKDLKSLDSSGLSLMPIGLEATITVQQMADLLAFLRR